MTTQTLKMMFAAAWIAFAAPAAEAEHSAYLKAQTERSLQEALANESVSLLEARLPESSASEQLDSLRERLNDLLTAGFLDEVGALTVTDADSDSVIAQSESGAYLEVDEDSSVFRFRVGGQTARVEASARRLTLYELENLAWKVLAGPLADYVPLSEADELVFLGSQYLIEDEADIETNQTTERVVGHIALFGREVEGIFVVGAGSKLALWFTGAGNLMGFDVNWPRYERHAETQATVSIEDVWARFDAYAEQEVPRPGQAGDASVSTRRFECGYVDLGARKRRHASIQAGCFAHVDGFSDDGAVRIAQAEVMPIGEPVERDPNWPATKAMLGEDPDPCADDAPGCGGPPGNPSGPAPFFVTTMTHMEGGWADALPGRASLFVKHAAQLRLGARLAMLHDATLTVESEIPFSSAQIIYGDDVMAELHDRYGHGVGTHCDIGPRINAGTGIDYTALMESAVGATGGPSLFDIGFESSLTPTFLSAFAGLHLANFPDELVDLYVEDFLLAYGFSLTPGAGGGPGASLGLTERGVLELVAEWRVRKVLVDELVGAENNLGCSGGGGLSDWVQAAELADFAYVDGVVGYHFLPTLSGARPPGWTNPAIFGGLYHEPAPVLLEDRVHPVFLDDALDLQEDLGGDVLMSPGSIGRLEAFDGTTGDLTLADVAGALDALEDAVAAQNPTKVGKATFYLPAAIFTEANEPVLAEFFDEVQSRFVEPGRASWASQREVYDAVVAWEEFKKMAVSAP